MKYYKTFSREKKEKLFNIIADLDMVKKNGFFVKRPTLVGDVVTVFTKETAEEGMTEILDSFLRIGTGEHGWGNEVDNVFNLSYIDGYRLKELEFLEAFWDNRAYSEQSGKKASDSYPVDTCHERKMSVRNELSILKVIIKYANS